MQKIYETAQEAHQTYLNIQSQLRSFGGDDARQIIDAELLGELIEHPHLSLVCRVIDGNLNTPNSVSNVKETTRLASFPIDRQRVAHSSLDDEAVQGSAENPIVVVPASSQPPQSDMMRRSISWMLRPSSKESFTYISLSLSLSHTHTHSNTHTHTRTAFSHLLMRSGCAVVSSVRNPYTTP